LSVSDFDLIKLDGVLVIKMGSMVVAAFEKHFYYEVGAELTMNAFKRHTHHQRMKGMGKAKLLLKQA
jgi:hypothetical protein